MSEIYEGRCIGLGVLPDLAVDTLRLRYVLTRYTKHIFAQDLGGYAILALTSPKLGWSDAKTIVRDVGKRIREGIPYGTSLVYPRGGVATTELLRVHLDWAVENYYNEADLISEHAKRTAPDVDMIFLFADGKTSDLLAANKLIERKLDRYGLAKGVVAMGHGEHVTVYETENGHDTEAW